MEPTFLRLERWKWLVFFSGGGGGGGGFHVRHINNERETKRNAHADWRPFLIIHDRVDLRRSWNFFQDCQCNFVKLLFFGGGKWG